MLDTYFSLPVQCPNIEVLSAPRGEVMLAGTSEATPVEDVFEPLNFVLFCAIVLATLVGIPVYGYFVGFSLFDWILSLVMYIVTGMGITVG